jgi:Collagen triple helix repeat (20 copies)
MIFPPPMESGISDKGGKFTTPWIRFIQNLFNTVVPVQNYGVYSISAPSTGFNISVPDNTEILQLTPVAALATGTVALPANPVDKQRVTISSTQSIAAFTLTASSPISNPPSALTGGQSMTYYYSKSNNTWYSTSAGSGSGGGSSGPAGVSTQVQVNLSGAFYATANFTYNPVSNKLSVSNIAANSAVFATLQAPNFNTTTQGLVPASGGGTGRFLSAEGNFVPVPGGGQGADGDDGEPGFPVPGPPGTPGTTGAAGAAGPAIFLEALDGEDGQPGTPGARGLDGVTGAAGPIGPAVFLEALDGEDGQAGPPGQPGVIGVTGALGPAGPAIFLEAQDGEDGQAGPPGQAGLPGVAGVPGTAAFPIALDGADGEDGIPIPGTPGLPGSTGGVGPAGPAIFLEAQDGEDGQPGTPGVAGPAGPAGVAAFPIALDGADGDDGMPIPGIPGPVGAVGASGPAGPAIFLEAFDGEDGQPGTPGPAGIAGVSGSQGPVGPAVYLEAQEADEPMIQPGPAGQAGTVGSQGPVGPAVYLESDVPDIEHIILPPFQPGQRFLRTPVAAAVADQAISAATITLITGTPLAPAGFYVGQVFRWLISGNSAAVGTAANTINVKIGIANTTADANVATFTTPVGTAVASEFTLEVILTIRTLGATASAVARLKIINAGGVGFINVNATALVGTMATFNSTTAAQFVHVDITTGAAKTATVQMAFGEVVAPANPQALLFN